MQKIKLLQKYGANRANDILSVSNNKAHYLIENKIGVLIGYETTGIFKAPADKMMRAELKAERKRRKGERIKSRKPKIYEVK